MNKNYLKDFVPYKQALELKKLGFDEPCLAKYSIDIAGETLPHFRYNNRISQAESIDEGVWFNHNLDKDHIWSAPTFFQAFRWFREKYGLHQNITQYYGERFYFKIEDMFFPKRYEAYPLEKLRDLGEYVSQEEAERECLKKLIEIVKQKL